MRKSILVVILLLASNTLSYFIGSHTKVIVKDLHEDFSFPQYYKTEDLLHLEHEHCIAWMELAHHFLYDNNPADPDDLNKKHDFWNDSIMGSKYFNTIDSLNEGNWEYWYCNWE